MKEVVAGIDIGGTNTVILKKISGLKLAGIGIGAPDANYNSGTIEQATNLVWW